MAQPNPLRILYCDESNLEEKRGDFLLYGGLMIDSATMPEFSSEIDRLRSKFGVPRQHRLKFNPGPKRLEHDKFIELKRELIETCIKFDAALIVYAILHDIATSPNEARRNGINTVCFHFDCLLHRLGAFGLVLIDRFRDEQNKIDDHLVDKFMIGVTDMPFSKEIRLQRILGFHYSAVGQSHFPGVIDVLLGSLRFALNAFTRHDEKKMDTAERLLKLLSPLFVWGKESGRVLEISFILSPKVVKVEEYKDRYRRLISFFERNGISLQQKFE
jgi:hypothetical protein